MARHELATVSVNERLFVSDLRHAPSQRYNTAYCIRWLETLKAPPTHLVETYGTASEHPWLAPPGERPSAPQTAMSNGMSPSRRGFRGYATPPSRYRSLRFGGSSRGRPRTSETGATTESLPELTRKPIIRASNAVEISRLHTRVMDNDLRPRESILQPPKCYSNEKSPRLTLKAQRLIRRYGFGNAV